MSQPRDYTHIGPLCACCWPRLHRADVIGPDRVPRCNEHDAQKAQANAPRYALKEPR